MTMRTLLALDQTLPLAGALAIVLGQIEIGRVTPGNRFRSLLAAGSPFPPAVASIYTDITCSASRGQQPGLHERRLAAAARPVDHAHGESDLVARLDAVFPEAEALGQAVLVARTGKKLQEEIAVVGVE